MKIKEEMQFLLVLDFDMVITDWDASLTRKRADRIAEKLLEIMNVGNTQILILSMANMFHIMETVRRSGSELLMGIIGVVKKIVIDDIRYLTEMDARKGESKKGMHEMVREIMSRSMSILSLESPLSLEEKDEKIRVTVAYKKTHALQRLSISSGVPVLNIFFLDDQELNVRFAKHYGFHAIQIRSEPTMTSADNPMILRSLDRILKRVLRWRKTPI